MWDQCHALTYTNLAKRYPHRHHLGRQGFPWRFPVAALPVQVMLPLILLLQISAPAMEVESPDGTGLLVKGVFASLPELVFLHFVE